MRTELEKETEARENEFKKRGYDTEQFGGFFQECRLPEIESNKQFMATFCPFPEDIKPHRLRVSDAIYGGRLETLIHLWIQEKSSKVCNLLELIMQTHHHFYNHYSSKKLYFID